MRTSSGKRVDSRSTDWLVREVKTSLGSTLTALAPSARSPRMNTRGEEHDSANWKSPRSRLGQTHVRTVSDGSTDDDGDETPRGMDTDTYFSNGQRVHTAPEVTFSTRKLVSDDYREGSGVRRVGSLFHSNIKRHAANGNGHVSPRLVALERAVDDGRDLSNAVKDGADFPAWNKLNLSKLAAKTEPDEDSHPQSGRSTGRSGRSSGIPTSGGHGWNPGGCYTPRSHGAFTPRSHSDVQSSVPRAASRTAATTPRPTTESVHRIQSTLVAENERLHEELGGALRQNDALKKSFEALEHEIASLRKIPRATGGASASGIRATTAVPRWSQAKSRSASSEDSDSSKNLLQVMREKNELQTELESVRLDLARERMRRRQLEEDVQSLADAKDKYAQLHLKHYGHPPIRAPSVRPAAHDRAAADNKFWSSNLNSRQPAAGAAAQRRHAEEVPAQTSRSSPSFTPWAGLVSSLGF